MKISFIGILTRPLKLKTLSSLIFNLFLLFLPAILLANFLGLKNLFFKILIIIAMIIINGYLFKIFQHEMETENSDTFPKWKFINDFFLGLKGIFFYLECLIILAGISIFLWFISGYFPDFRNIAAIIIILLTVYWVLFYIPIALGLYSKKFNLLEAIKLYTISEIAIGSWLNYLKAGLFMIAYIILLALIGWTCTIIFGQNYINFIIGFVSLYVITVYLPLYAKVFVQSKTNFESYF